MKRELSFLLAAAMAASLAGCAADIADADSSITALNDSATAELTSYNAADAVTLTFTDSGIAGGGSSVEIDGTALTVSESGTYILTGSCADGSVKIKKGVTDVTLILSDLTLTSSTTAPIVCGKSSQVTIHAAEGTTNTLTDAAQNNDTEYADNADAENAVIKCKDGAQVVLCGSGSLTLNANGKNGIKSGTTDSETAQEASLTIRELTLTINAPVNDAVNAEQLLNVESGTITIDAEDDALHCDLVMNVGADGTDGPTITITNAYEGLEAATLNIASGNIDITCSDDCLNAASSLLTDYDFAMNISGGTIRAYTTAGDGFDSNGTMTISGGDMSSGFGGGQRPDISEQPADGERPELPDNADTQPDDAPSPPQGKIENAPQGVPDMDGEAATQQPPMMQADDSTDSGSISLTADTTYTFAADTASVEATARIDTSSTGMEGGMGGQRPDGGRQQNADVLPADDTQKRSA